MWRTETNPIHVDYVIIDVIDLKQEDSNHRISSLTCEVSLGNKKIGDLSLARKDHGLQVPISKGEENIQFNVFPMTTPNKRLGMYLVLI